MAVNFHNKYPYTDFHELNLDWIIEQMVSLDKKFAEFTAANELTLADPINWDISKEYAKNTITVDPVTGIAYISLQPVPQGITLDNTDYWMPVFNVVDLLDTYKDELIAALSNFIFYAPNYGIIPDTGEDLYERIFYFCKNVVEPAGGGIVYFPPGQYNVSYTVFIPENTIFIGAGRETIIYFDETDTTAGTALSNGGSNVGIINMTINSVSTDIIPSSGALPGSIGISNIVGVSEPYSHDFTRAAMENIYVHNIYSDTNYVMQVEPSAARSLKNVTVDGIYAPESMVSLNPNNAAENIVYRNIVCDFFRFGTTGHGKHIVADTVRCRTARFMNYPATGENYGNIEPLHVSNLDLNSDGTHSDMPVPVRINGPIDFVNCTFRNDAALGTDATGITIVDKFNGAVSYNNCRFHAITGKVYTYSVSPISNAYDYDLFTGCILTQIDTSVASAIVGKLAGCVVNGRFRITSLNAINRTLFGRNTALVTSDHTIALQNITIANGIVDLQVRLTVSDVTNVNLFTVVSSVLKCPMGITTYAEVWNSSTPATKTIYQIEMTAAGLVKFSAAHSGYNTVDVHLVYNANDNATIADMFALSREVTYAEMNI